jgi:hypothetical protein
MVKEGPITKKRKKQPRDSWARYAAFAPQTPSGDKSESSNDNEENSDDDEKI